MGVDTCIYIPDTVRIRDLANAIGILAGLKIETENEYKTVKGIEVKNSSVLGCVDIDFKSPIDKENHNVMLHLEPKMRNYKLLMPRSTPFWLAIGIRLINHFGGLMDFNDSDAIDFDESRQENPLNGAYDGETWRMKQEELYSLEPMTKEEVNAMNKYAAYKETIK